MATIAYGDMLDNLDKCDHALVCAGSALRSQTKELVMMNGCGYTLSQRYPQAPKAFGAKIQTACGDAGIYWLICEGKFGLFQNVILPRNGVHLGVISGSTKKLNELALANPGKKYFVEAFWLPDPQFACQGFIDTMPDNVTIWVTP